MAGKHPNTGLRRGPAGICLAEPTPGAPAWSGPRRAGFPVARLEGWWSKAMSRRWQVQLVGRLDGTSGGPHLDVTLCRPPQARLLLAYLVLERHRPVAREQAAALLWEDYMPPATWEAALRVLIGRVRVFLVGQGLAADALTTTGGCYQLRAPERTSVDVEDAYEDLRASAAALENGSAAMLREAIHRAESAHAVFARPWLPGLSGRWCDARREEHLEHLGDTLAIISRTHELRGEHVAAVAAARKACTLQPLRESALRRLMDAHHRAGDRSAAIEAYHNGRRRLREKLGIEPDAHTRRLFKSLLEDDQV